MTRSPVGGPPDRMPWRAVIGGSIGNLVEWYDWFVYASFATYFAAAFFPTGTPPRNC